MAHPPETKAQLRRLYVYERLSVEGAADRLGIGIATARRWKSMAETDGDDWERARSAARLAGDGIQNVCQMVLDDYMTLHQATIEELRTDKDASPLAKAEAMSRLADAFTKTMAAVGKASPQLSRLAVATDVLQRLAKFVGQSRPDVAGALLEVLEPFAAEISREFS